DELAAAHRVSDRVAEHAPRRDRAAEDLAGGDVGDLPGERDARRLSALAAARRSDQNEIQTTYFTSLRTMAAPSASALSFILATMRASGFMPQSVLSVSFSAGTCLSANRIRSATCSGFSIAFVRMSSTPSWTPVSFGRFFKKSTPSMWRLA